MSLDAWIKRSLESGKAGLRSEGQPKMNRDLEALRKENEELKKALAERELDVRVLKKLPTRCRRLAEGSRDKPGRTSTDQETVPSVGHQPEPVLSQGERVRQEQPPSLAERAQELAEKIKLLTDNGPAMISKGFRTYIAGSPFVHLRTKSHQPETIGCIERFHQTLKYEEVWGAMYENPLVAKKRIEVFRVFYNTECIHQTLRFKTPLEGIEEWKHKQSTDQTTYAHVA